MDAMSILVIAGIIAFWPTIRVLRNFINNEVEFQEDAQVVRLAASRGELLRDVKDETKEFTTSQALHKAILDRANA